jgi:pimeloyl-ACP methyl ester carboxylesterase
MRFFPARRMAILCPIVMVACLLSMPATSYAAASASSQCSNVNVPVSLAPGEQATDSIFGVLCVPAGATPQTIELLVPGITYTDLYWSFPDPTGGTDRYNFTAAANQAGFATLAIDRIGTGQSSHPLSALVTIQSNAWTVHQVIQAIRNGVITAPGGSTFSKIVYVGHSYGSWTGWFEISEYNDVNAFVDTGATHHPNTAGEATVLSHVYPADLDPQFSSLGLDPGYLTTEPGSRYEDFYGTAAADPAVVAYDEAHKSTVTAGEIDNFPLILAQPLNIQVPVLMEDGTLDPLFCGPAEGGADCSSATALIASEASYLGPSVPSVDAYVLPGAGHDLNMALDAPDYFAVTQQWIAQTVGGAAAAG